MAAFGPRKVQFVAQLQAQRRQVFERRAGRRCESWPARKAKSLRLATRSISRAQSPQGVPPGGAWSRSKTVTLGWCASQLLAASSRGSPMIRNARREESFSSVEKENSPRHSAGRQFSSVATS